MRKLFCAFLLMVFVVFADEQLTGNWSFVFYEQAETADRIMPPPVFNAIEFKDNNMATVKVRAKEMSFDVPYKCDGKTLEMQLPLRGPYEQPIKFKAEYKYLEKEGTFIIKGRNSSAVYVRTEMLMPMSKIAGLWRNVNNSKMQELMEIKQNGLMKLHATNMTGFGVLWPDEKGAVNLTMVAGVKNGAAHTFLWQIWLKGDNKMEMVPITQNGPDTKFITTWVRNI